jgi:hypothetical protein
MAAQQAKKFSGCLNFLFGGHYKNFEQILRGQNMHFISRPAFTTTGILLE